MNQHLFLPEILVRIEQMENKQICWNYLLSISKSKKNFLFRAKLIIWSTIKTFNFGFQIYNDLVIENKIKMFASLNFLFIFSIAFTNAFDVASFGNQIANQINSKYKQFIND